jgi:cytosine/adenosine deaminase-related metal-dependent hydrolase
MRVFTADHVFPVAAPPIRKGAVATRDGRVLEVGPADAVLRSAGEGTPVQALGSAALLPGLVNAHCHVELSWMEQDPPPAGDYVSWVRGLIDRRAEQDLDRARQAAEIAIEQMVSRGTVALGDVGNETWVVPLLASSTLYGISFLEVFEPRTADAERRIGEAVDRLEQLTRDPEVMRARERWRVVLAPHAPHTTAEGLLRALAGRAVAAGDPLSIHVAESAAEVDLLREGSGALVDLFRDRGMWDDDWRPPGHTPIEHLDRLGVLTARCLAVHCVRLVHGDRSRLQVRRCHVVTCPRSNERLGVGTAPIPELLGEGIPVALGTDSLASSPDLDLFAEMAALSRLHPRLAPAAVLRMATLNGATALGLDDRLGSIEPGKLDRLVVVPLEADDEEPLLTLCSSPATRAALCTGRRHPRRGRDANHVEPVAVDRRGHGRRAQRRDGVQPPRRPGLRRTQPAHGEPRVAQRASHARRGLDFHVVARCSVRLRLVPAVRPVRPPLTAGARRRFRLLVHETLHLG